MNTLDKLIITSSMINYQVNENRKIRLVIVEDSTTVWKGLLKKPITMLVNETITDLDKIKLYLPLHQYALDIQLNSDPLDSISGAIVLLRLNITMINRFVWTSLVNENEKGSCDFQLDIGASRKRNL